MKRYIRSGRNLYSNSEICANQEDANTQTISAENISELIAELKQSLSGKIVAKGDYLRYTSYENDYVTYYSIPDMISGLNSDGVSFEEALDEPDLLLDYGEIESAGVHHSSDIPEYKEFKKSRNIKYGFSKKK